MHFKLFKNKEKTQEKTVLKSQKSHKKTREKSLGRSMVEMLGVLAIIGVLSIGGIAGYTMAMRRYKANEILAAYQKYAVSLYTSAHQGILDDKVFVGEDGRWIMKDKFQHSWLATDLNKSAGLLFSEIIYASYNGIKSTDSGDFVLISISMKNKSLCETIVSITGETATGTGTGLTMKNGIEQCEKVSNNNEEYLFYISFLMN